MSLPEGLQPYYVLSLIVLAALAMASNRIRYDFIALTTILLLVAADILPLNDALSGFSNSVVILIAALLVVGESLDRTGVARSVGDWILTRGGAKEWQLLALIMISSALLSAIMSSTAVVAIFIPIILRICQRSGRSASTLLLPMSYAALVSGMLTLIATPPNLVISNELDQRGYEPLGFFTFFPVGLIVLVATIIYMLVIGRRLLPNTHFRTGANMTERTTQELWQAFNSQRSLAYLRCSNDSPLDTITIGNSGLYKEFGIRILAIFRAVNGRETFLTNPDATVDLHRGDLLCVTAPQDGLPEIQAHQGLVQETLNKRQQQLLQWEHGLATLMIHPDSGLIGRTLRDIEFRRRHDLDVQGILRQGQPLTDFENEKLNAGDTLLVAGSWQHIHRLQGYHHDFVLLEKPRELKERPPSYQRRWAALSITGAMILFSIIGAPSLVMVVLIAAMAVVACRCLSPKQAYDSIQWSSLVLLAGMLPLADALQRTGATEMIVDGMLHSAGSNNPMVMLSLLFFLTAALTMVISNTAAAVLMAPIAIDAAMQLGVSPYPLALTVLFAASSAFLTPVASPVVTMVVDPGRYRFIDFLTLGTPLLLLVYGVCYFVLPRVFPW